MSWTLGKNASMEDRLKADEAISELTSILQNKNAGQFNKEILDNLERLLERFPEEKYAVRTQNLIIALYEKYPNDLGYKMAVHLSRFSYSPEVTLHILGSLVKSQEFEFSILNSQLYRAMDTSFSRGEISLIELDQLVQASLASGYAPRTGIDYEGVVSLLEQRSLPSEKAILQQLIKLNSTQTVKLTRVVDSNYQQKINQNRQQGNLQILLDFLRENRAGKYSDLVEKISALQI